MGYSDGAFVFRNQETNEIIRRSAKQLASLPELLEMAPNYFWEKTFPKIDIKGNILGIDLKDACDGLIRACRKEGYIDPSRMRGIGVWREGDKIIRNLGAEIIQSDEYLYSCPPRRLQLKNEPFP